MTDRAVGEGGLLRSKRTVETRRLKPSTSRGFYSGRGPNEGKSIRSEKFHESTGCMLHEIYAAP